MRNIDNNSNFSRGRIETLYEKELNPIEKENNLTF